MGAASSKNNNNINNTAYSLKTIAKAGVANGNPSTQAAVK